MTRALRRHQAYSHMMRRLTEDRNQHYNTLDCLCYLPGKAMARFKEQPCHCSKRCCGNPRRHRYSREKRLTIQERRQDEAERVAAEESREVLAPSLQFRRAGPI